MASRTHRCSVIRGVRGKEGNERKGEAEGREMGERWERRMGGRKQGPEKKEKRAYKLFQENVGPAHPKRTDQKF